MMHEFNIAGGDKVSITLQTLRHRKEAEHSNESYLQNRGLTFVSLVFYPQ
jgi:hypothetical protein